jgi:hypothetical protein
VLAERIIKPRREAVAAALQVGIDQGVLRAGLDPSAIAAIFTAVLSNPSLFEEFLPSDKAAGRMFDNLWAIFSNFP